MAYDFKKPKDLVKWAEVQYNNPNYYIGSGIGRYDGSFRQFDCCGLFKCFMWHDYSQKNYKYYNVTQKDLNCEGLLAEAKEKGTIDTIPEIPGVLVYMPGHMGIYIGNGEVIESTGAAFDGKHSKIYKTYFKGTGHKGCYKRATWTHWFKSPNLVYEEPKPIELKYAVGDKVVVNGALYSDSKGNGKGKTLSDYVGIITLTNDDHNTTKPYHIDKLGWVAESDIELYVEPIEAPKTPNNDDNSQNGINIPEEPKETETSNDEEETKGIIKRIIELIIKLIKKLVSK